MKRISILIPTYNTDCTQLVGDLRLQAEGLGMVYEIIVADDGSTDRKTVAANQMIGSLPGCRLIMLSSNIGRAAIRNLLAREAQYEWLLFIDSDMVVCRQDFVRCYALCSGASVYYGGYQVGPRVKGNLRSKYEKAAEPRHTPQQRQQSPYRDFHTANFLVSRYIMMRHPFDERFRHYGYEDVLFGRQLHEAQVPICHLGNPLSFEVFESNAHFIDKAEEGLRTLNEFRHELEGYSTLLDRARRMCRLKPLIRLWHAINKGWERRLLAGSHPSLFIFSLYRLGYFLSLDDRKA